MAKVIQAFAPHPDISREATTELTAGVSAGSSVALSVDNNKPSTKFAQNAYVVVGRVGDERCEIAQISSVSGANTITVSTLLFAHLENEPVTFIPYNKVHFCRRDTATGDPSNLGSAVDIDVSNPAVTIYNDSDGDDDYYYGARFYNSTSDTYSEALADVELYLASQSGAYAVSDEIRRFSGFEGNSNIQDERFKEFITDAENTIDSYIGKIYSLPLSSVPGIIRYITWLLAGGNMLIKEYGAEGLDTQKDGERWINRALELLKQIANGDIGLFDTDGSELTKVSGIVGDYDNIYSSDTEDRGDLFNLKEENFSMEDPDDPA